MGLDIGASSVKMVHLNHEQEKYSVTGAGIVDIPDVDDDENWETNAASAAKDCFASSRIQTSFVACSVSGPETAVRSFQFPPLAPDEMKGAVLMEARQLCPFDIENAAVSYQLLSKNNNKAAGILAGATNSLIKRKKNVAKNASLHCTLMDIDGLALLNCFKEIEKPNQEQTFAILNVGLYCASLVITSKDAPPFVRDITHNGKKIAEKTEAQNDKSAYDELVRNINATFSYYTAERTYLISKLYVCGDIAITEGFVEILAEKLPVDVQLWNPFDNMVCLADENCQKMLCKKGPALAVAAGLAMRKI